jgi:hypothetical protein
MLIHYSCIQHGLLQLPLCIIYIYIRSIYYNNSFLYYVNDSDGDTFLFDEFQKDTIPLNFNILERISPKKGKGIFFESDRYHASSNPKHTSIRLVLNFNFY